MASHPRSHRAQAYTTTPEHQPKSHQKYLEWTPSRMVEWAGSIGPFTARLAEIILAERPHPEQGFRSCLGLIRLGKKYGLERMEAAWTRAERLKAHSYQNVKSILATGMDRQPLPQLVAPRQPLEHENIRGADYERFALLVDHHWNWRKNQATVRRLKKSKLNNQSLVCPELPWPHGRGSERRVGLDSPESGASQEVWISELFRIPITDQERSLLETFVAPRTFGGIGEALALTEEHKPRPMRPLRTRIAEAAALRRGRS